MTYKHKTLAKIFMHVGKTEVQEYKMCPGTNNNQNNSLFSMTMTSAITQESDGIDSVCVCVHVCVSQPAFL